MVFNATFNNISVISWRSVLLLQHLILYIVFKTNGWIITAFATDVNIDEDSSV